MVQRSLTWLIFLVLLLLAGLWIMDRHGTLENQVALIEVDNRSGEDLTAIDLSWAGGDQHWPGVKSGESALLRLAVKQPADFSLRLSPGGRTVSRRIAPGQRLYLRLEAEGISMSVNEDPSLGAGGQN